MYNATTIATPLEDTKLELNADPLDVGRQKWYQFIVGSLMWISQLLRPDITFAVGLLSRFSHNPSEDHLRVSKRVLRYLKGTAVRFLTLGNPPSTSLDTPLVGYCDANYAGDLATRRSTTGYIFQFLGSTISWSSNRENTVALSTCEAEYMAMAEAIKEGIWLIRVLNDLGQPQENFTVFCDNQGAIALSENPGKVQTCSQRVC
jgi:hypothetical protein